MKAHTNEKAYVLNVEFKLYDIAVKLFTRYRTSPNITPLNYLNPICFDLIFVQNVIWENMATD